jgi:crotonobetainyl-CoA:carnitine CoA-transferase CaiB-like acyl-CoA transferase
MAGRLCGVDFLPLHGVRVVDVTTSLAGPYCTEVLAALGADVIKVEPPGTGDEARSWGPPFWDGESAMFLAMNAGKRSVTLDLRKGTDVVLRIAEGADVFVQSLRPGLAAELGLDAESLRGRDARLVHCSITSFGRTGPWAMQPGYDPLAQAAGGIVSVTGEPGRPGVRAGVSLVDQGTGLWAALGVVAALMEREHTGQGRAIDVSLYETAIAYMTYHLTGYLGSGTVPGRTGTGFPSIAPYQVFRTADGELMVAAGNDRLFTALCVALDLPQLPSDARFETNPSRVAHREELAPLLAERFRTKDTAAWLAALEGAGVPATPVQDAGQVAEAAQTAALGILQELGARRIVALPLSADGERVNHRTAPPSLGQDTAAVLTEAGYTSTEIEDLAERGIVRLPT